MNKPPQLKDFRIKSIEIDEPESKFQTYGPIVASFVVLIGLAIAAFLLKNS